MQLMLDPLGSLPQSKSVDTLQPVEARLQLAAIVDSSDDAIISKDLEGIITSWNSSATRLFGYRPAEIIGQSVLTLIPPELHEEEPEILRKVTAGERIEHFETRRRRKNGEIINISLTISPIRDTTGRIIGISKIARDITQRKLTEAALFEADRMAAIGRMAATIAHEVNNPLEAILNLGYLLSGHPTLDDEAREYARLLVSEVLRVSDITRRTLSFYRDSSEPTQVDITSVLESVLSMHRPLLEQRCIAITTKFQPATLSGYRPGELRQVFTNLVINAIDAMPEGGQLRISATSSSIPDRVCVTIADNGTGIPGSVLGRIFEPFFSTKLAKGTGLGLWISQGIVRKYSGSIRVRTTTTPSPKTGTAFRVCLPCRQVSTAKH